MYVFPKKVTYPGGQVGNQEWKVGCHWVKTSRNGEPTGRNVNICFGSILFSLDEWILCSDNQNLQNTCAMDKWGEKKVFCPALINNFVHLCTYHVVETSTWIDVPLTYTWASRVFLSLLGFAVTYHSKQKIRYHTKKIIHSLIYGDHKFHLLVNNNQVETSVSSTLHEIGRMTG